MLASVCPRDIADETRRRVATEELAELVAIEAKIKRATADLKTMVLARGSKQMDLHGVRPVVPQPLLRVPRVADLQAPSLNLRVVFTTHVGAQEFRAAPIASRS